MARLKVECRAQGTTGATGPEPSRFGQPGAMRDVAAVIDRWPGEDHQYFRVRCEDDAVYILRHDLRADAWQIVFFERGHHLE